MCVYPAMINLPSAFLTLVTPTTGQVCSSFECPENYSAIDDASSTVCKDSGCTKDLCCDKDGARH